MKLAVFRLQNAGYTGCSALRTREESGLTTRARGRNPDLILMDIQLPGMDWPVRHCAASSRTKATRAIPVIALTALAMKGDEARIRARGLLGLPSPKPWAIAKSSPPSRLS